MQKVISKTAVTVAAQLAGSGKPSMPVAGRQPVTERKIADPSSTYPKGERYPIPSFFEYRIKAREFDPL